MAGSRQDDAWIAASPDRTAAHAGRGGRLPRGHPREAYEKVMDGLLVRRATGNTCASSGSTSPVTPILTDHPTTTVASGPTATGCSCVQSNLPLRSVSSSGSWRATCCRMRRSTRAAATAFNLAPHDRRGKAGRSTRSSASPSGGSRREHGHRFPRADVRLPLPRPQVRSDPQQGFHLLFAFFNSLDAEPLDGTRPPIRRWSRLRPGPVRAAKQRSDAVRKQIAEEVAKVQYDEAADKDQPEQAKPAEFVWIDETAPPTGEASATPRHRQQAGPSGPQRRQIAAAVPQRSRRLQGANPGLRVGEGRRSLSPMSTLDAAEGKFTLHGHSDGWQAPGCTGARTQGGPEHDERGDGSAPKAGEWVRLELAAAKVGIKASTMLDRLGLHTATTAPPTGTRPAL